MADQYQWRMAGKYMIGCLIATDSKAYTNVFIYEDNSSNSNNHNSIPLFNKLKSRLQRKRNGEKLVSKDGMQVT